MDDIVMALKAAKRRNPLAWQLIGMFSGLGEQAIKDIAGQKREATKSERLILQAYKDAVI